MNEFQKCVSMHVCGFEYLSMAENNLWFELCAVIFLLFEGWRDDLLMRMRSDVLQMPAGREKEAKTQTCLNHQSLEGKARTHEPLSRKCMHLTVENACTMLSAYPSQYLTSGVLGRSRSTAKGSVRNDWANRNASVVALTISAACMITHKHVSKSTLGESRVDPISHRT